MVLEWSELIRIKETHDSHELNTAFGSWRAGEMITMVMMTGKGIKAQWDEVQFTHRTLVRIQLASLEQPTNPMRL